MHVFVGMEAPHVGKQTQPFTETVQVARWRGAVYGALCYYNSCDSWPSESNGGKTEKQQDLYKGNSKCQVFANAASMQLPVGPDDWKIEWIII